jgi:hypothetical protein
MANGVKDAQVIARRSLLVIARRHDWSKHLLGDHKLTGRLPDVLLNELKIPYRVNDEGGVLPG